MTKRLTGFSVFAIALLLLASFPMFDQPTAVAQSEAGERRAGEAGPNGPMGACIELDACSDGIDAFGCAAFGGVWIGAGSTCDSNPIVLFSETSRACCLGDGNCAALTPALCAEAGGTSWPIDTPCFFAECPKPCTADTDGDGTVGILDFLDVLGQWGVCP